VLREHELRPVTALVADIVGPASLWERLAPERTQQLIDECLERLTRVAAEQGGMVQLHTHSAIRAYFGVPTRRDDDLDRTAGAALRMVDEIEAHARAVAQAWNVEAVHVRIGIEGVDASSAQPAGGGAAVGNVVDTAAALQAAAAPDTIVVGNAAASGLARSFELQPLGVLVAEGTAPVEGFRLTRRRPAAPAASPARGG
jgi:class 3 adenylate cyclase